MAKNLSAVRQEVRQILQDEFQSGTDYIWPEDELDQYIQDILMEISMASPYQVKVTATADGTKKIDLTDISNFDVADLISVEKAEYEVDQDPEQFRNVTRFGDILTLDIDTAPTADDDINLYCNLVHTLDETTSTLNRLQEALLVKGTCGQAAIAKSRKYIDEVNVGGAGVSTQMYNWGVGKLTEFRQGLMRLGRPQPYQEYASS